MDRTKGFILFGQTIDLGFKVLKDMLPIITDKKNKKNTNKIILGKCHKKK